jgi:hypothetical protein
LENTAAVCPAVHSAPRALIEVEADRQRMKKWQVEKVATAARVFHICDVGKDIDIDDPFAVGAATEKPIRYLSRVPGSPEHAV